jgi:hypothetical protein
VQGLNLGLDDSSVARSGARLATSLTDGFGTPALAAYMSAPGLASRVPNINLHLTADVVDDIQRGKRYSLSLDAAGNVGVRKLA